MATAFKGDLVFVVDDFLFRDEIGIMDVYLRNSQTGEPKAFRIHKGVLIFPSPNGDIPMGNLLLVAHPGADIVEAVKEKWPGRKVVIIPAT